MTQDLIPFAEELEDVALQLASLDASVESEADIESFSQQVLDEYARLQMASALYQMDGIQKTSDWFIALLENFKNELPEAIIELQLGGHLSTWLELAAIALREPDEPQHLAELSQALLHEELPTPVPEEHLEALLVNVRTALLATNNSESSDNSNPLTWSADIHPELLDAYLQETPQQVEQAADLIYAIADGKANAKQKQHAARLAHTIKGASAVVGIEPLASFTHKLEDVLEFDVTPALGAGLSDTLHASADCLHSLFDNLIAKQSLPDSYAGLLTELGDWHTRLASGENFTSTSESTPDTSISTPTETIQKEQPQQTLIPDFVTLGALPDAQDKVEISDEDDEYTPARYINVPVDMIQQMLSLVGESMTRTTQVESQLKRSNERLRQNQLQDTRIRQIFDELEDAIDQQVNLSQSQSRAVGKLDDLELEQYNILHSTHGLLAESVADHREINRQLQQSTRSMTDLVKQQRSIQLQLSDQILQTRMLPVQSLVSRVERTVRETCRATGKKAQIEVVGQDLMMDTDTLQALTPPLLHMLRNAVDHGIESPEERRTKDKPEQGKLRLSFTQEQAHIRMRLSDDGAGFNREKIRTRALEQGIITDDQILSDEETLRLILRPGFSTRTEVSETSGRGVGMDVVHHAVQNLRGQLHLGASQDTIGSQITIEVPLTLISTQAIIVHTAQQWLAIPIHYIEQTAQITNDQVELQNGQLVAHHEGESLPVYSLATLLQWQSSTLPEQGAYYLRVQFNDEPCWLQVEDLQAEQDIVIKDLTPWQNISPYIHGATILADGGVAPVLDLFAVLNNVQAENMDVALPQPEDHKTTLLVVDDSLSNRTAVSQMVERMGYQVITARDGVDGLECLRKQRIDLILTDLEMPRMNGLEMTQAVRAWEAVQNLPVIMLTSRSTQKHKQLADTAGINTYLTKPVDYQNLRDQVSQLLITE